MFKLFYKFRTNEFSYYFWKNYLMIRISYKNFKLNLVVSIMSLFLVSTGFASENDNLQLSKQASNSKKVSFHAWGGSSAINQYIQWVATKVNERHGIVLKHVKLTNTSHAVSRILAEKIAGKNEDGSVDLLWINGENFSTMKKAELLQNDGWAFELPSFVYVNPKKMPDTIFDFGIPTGGLESPWGRAQFVFGYNSKNVLVEPNSAVKLKNWIKTNAGKFTYPQPPDFLGTSFLKQLLLQLVKDIHVLYEPASASKPLDILVPLWEWLDETHPFLWRNGKKFPLSNSHLIRLLSDGEIDIAMSFNPAEFSYAVEQGILNQDIRSFIFEKGSLANVHFVTIPFNATSPDAAKLVANFLLSPEAQLQKANIRIWGDPTVLDIQKLPAKYRKQFKMLPAHPAMLNAEELQNIAAEPHPSWVELIEEEWLKRYAN